MKQFSFTELYQSKSVGEPILDAVTAALRQTHTLQSADIANLLEVRKRDLGCAVLLLTGMTLDLLIRTWRTRQAQDLLREGSLSEQQIAYRCGWRSVRVMRRNIVLAEQAAPK